MFFFGLFGESVGQIQVLSSRASQTELRWCLRPWNCWSPFCGKNDGQTLGAKFCFRKDWEREIWGDLKQKDVKIASLNHLGPLGISGSPGERIYLQKLFAMTHANVFGDFLDELKLNSYPHLAMQNNTNKTLNKPFMEDDSVSVFRNFSQQKAMEDNAFIIECYTYSIFTG